MNYLAHAYLSFGEPGILAGNLTSDFIKGKTKFNYSGNVLKGIDLHRAIDNYTDTHAATAAAKEVFRPHYRLYAGAFVDVVYDHFLATDEQQFPNGSLLPFTQNVYRQLAPFIPQAPERFQQLFPHMQSQNWLFNYQYRDGIARSFRGLVHRAAYMNDSLTALSLFDTHYHYLQDCYRRFFPHLHTYAHEYLYNKDTGN
jgi:acyl carrier protein phosphodiesterase